MTTRDDLDAALLAWGNTREAEGAQSRDAEVATLTTQVGALQGDLAEAQIAFSTLEAAFEAYRERNPEQSPPTATFSVYAGPMTTREAGQTPETRARCCAAFGVDVLPADRVYSATSFGKAAACPSPLVAVSYGLVPQLARGDATTIRNLTTELEALAAKTGQRWDVSADHEVDAKIRKGTYKGSDVAQAAARLQAIVDSIDAPNLRTAQCFTGWAFTLSTSDPSHPVNYWNPAWADLIALDPYWPTQKTVELAFDPCWSWASEQGKPVAIWETGWSTDSNPQNPTDAVAAQKTAAIVDYWKPKAEYVLFFESVKGDNLLEKRPAALALWADEMHA